MPDNIIFTALTHPSLERLRTFIPYPIYAGTVAAVVSIPVFALKGFMLGGRFVSGSTGSWMDSFFFVPAASFSAIAALMTLLSLGGLVSGYRPFRKKWDPLTDEEFRDVSARLVAAAEAEGYSIAWKRELGDFVGVMGIALERRSGPHPGNDFPVRISFLSKSRFARREAELRLDNRTVVLWDTGERARLSALGAALLSRAGLAV